MSISLINQDTNIFTALLVKRGNNFIGKYIKEDQDSFMIGRQVADLTRRVLNIIHIIYQQKLKAGVMPLDIFKAFDCVEWLALKNIDRYIRIWDLF